METWFKDDYFLVCVRQHSFSSRLLLDRQTPFLLLLSLFHAMYFMEGDNSFYSIQETGFFKSIISHIDLSLRVEGERILYDSA